MSRVGATPTGVNPTGANQKGANQKGGPAGDDAAIRFGLLCGLATYTMWGLFPAFFKLVEGVLVTEVLAHRIVWSVPFAALLLTLRGQWREISQALRRPRVLAMLALAAVAIAGNWGIYIWSVVNDRVMEASLGYYINPLVFIAAGVFILREPLRRMQTAAVVLAALGVIVLTVWVGAFPTAGVALALLFTAYGYIRKTVDVGSLPGLFIEVVILSPVALVYLLWLARQGAATFMAGDPGMNLVLALSGPLTVIPLTFFALAARRLRLTTLAFLQYIGPTLQFLLALYYGEPFTLGHGVAFGCIWLALAVFSLDAVRANRAAKAAAARAV